MLSSRMLLRRRGFLGTLGAIGAAAALPGCED
ncbi:MAG: twin-arginine translocation signal domain-containing protein [Sandaracinus sp.]|nr:twin-arginine translocation signal domain-containing protein [Sandaracinus sp.]